MDTNFQGEAVGRTCCYGLAGVVRRKGWKKHASRRTWFFFLGILMLAPCYLGGEQLGFSVERIGQVRCIDETAMIPFWRIITLDETEPRWREFGGSQPEVLHVFWGPSWKKRVTNFGRLVGRLSVLYLVSSRFDEFLRPIFDNGCLCTTWDEYWQASEHSTEKDENKWMKYYKKPRKKNFFWERNCRA